MIKDGKKGNTSRFAVDTIRERSGVGKLGESMILDLLMRYFSDISGLTSQILR